MIFFDGEEALVSWTSSDSLYGSRHLAAEMVRSGGLLSTAGKTAIEAMVCGGMYVMVAIVMCVRKQLLLSAGCFHSP